MTDEFDTYFDDDEEDASDEEESKSPDAAGGDKGSESESKEDVEKRIRDLQSKADKAEARANKLQKQLEAQGKSKNAATDDEGTEGVVPPEVRKWLDAAKERTLDQTFKSDGRFQKYKVDPAFIQADSPDALKERAKALAKMLSEIETQVRNEVLVEHGFSPQPATSERSEPKNYATMSSEEFNKIADRALNSGYLRRS